MPRRGENIYKRKDGRWEGRYIKDRMSNGKIKYGYVYSYSYKETKEKLKQIYQSPFVSNQSGRKEVYSSLLILWLESKRITVKESTFACYRRIVKNYIMPALGNLYVNQLTTNHIEIFLAGMMKTDDKNRNSGLSARTVSNILVVLKASLEYGRSNGYQVNCNEKRITLKDKEKEMRVLTRTEQTILSEFLRKEPDRYKFGTLLSLYTGIRIGELCALRWENISIDNHSVKINETLQRIQVFGESQKTKIVITEPKSCSSIRVIPLPDFLLSLVEQFRSHPKSYVLTADRNKFVEPRTMQYHFKQYIKQCHLEDANFHCLRHTFATRCVEAGFEIKSLSEILGHSNVNITLNKYVHSSFELKSQNMNKLSF